MSITTYNILFHGNCIDGWFSAYLANGALHQTANVVAHLHPISPIQSNHWPSALSMKGTHILLLDVSVELIHREAWLAAGVLSIECIDHHSASLEQWPNGTIKIDQCAALQTFQRFFPDRTAPFWLHVVDRIDRWDNPTQNDRCLREIFSIIAHKPVAEKSCVSALSDTDALIEHLKDEATVMVYVQRGQEILHQKDEAILQILCKWGKLFQIGQRQITDWALPVTWLGINVFIIDNSAAVMDSTEAAHLVFQHYSGVDVFINYRKKPLYKSGKKTTVFVYSARARANTLDITNGTIFNGHPTSAGASLVLGEAPLIPFICTF